MRRILVLTLIIGVACGKKSGPSEDELRQQIPTLRAKIAKYATTLADVQPFPVPAKLDPPIAFRNGAGGHTEGDNTEVFAFDGLAKGYDSFWEHSALMSALSSTDLVSKAVLAQAVATRYAIVIKKTEQVTAILTKDSYTPGKLAVRVYVVDLTTDKPVAVFDAAAATPETLKVETVVGADDSDTSKADQMATAARLKLWDEVLRELRTKIQSTLKPLGTANVYESSTAVE